MAAQHVVRVDVTGVARVAGDVGGVVAEVVVVVGDGDDPIARPPPDFGARSGRGRDGPLDDELDRVRPTGRIREIADGEVPGELRGG